MIYRDSHGALLLPAKGSSDCLGSMAQEGRVREKEREKKSTLAGAQGELNPLEHMAAETGLAIPCLKAMTVHDKHLRAWCEPAARGGAGRLHACNGIQPQTVIAGL